MTTDADAHGLLETFQYNVSIKGGVAFEKALRQVNLDYTPDSLGRIDQLLIQIRRQKPSEYGEFLDREDGRNFLLVLGVYIGVVVQRYTRLPSHWAQHLELLEQFADNETQAIPHRLETSLTLVLGDGYYMPMVAVVAVLFAPESTGSVLTAAEQWLRRAIGVPLLKPPLSPPARPLDVPSQALPLALYRGGECAGIAAGFAISTAIEDASTLTPMLADTSADGKTLFTSLMYDSMESANSEGMARIQADVPGTPQTVFVYDGYVNLPHYRTDALRINVRSYAAASADALRFHIALPYRPATNDQGFSLHLPRLMESSFECDEALLAWLAAGFFAGLNSSKANASPFAHEHAQKPGAVTAGNKPLWEGYFSDENSGANIAARVPASPPVAVDDPNEPLLQPLPPHNFEHMRLQDIALAKNIAALPKHALGEMPYTHIKPPEWIWSDDLRKWWVQLPKLLTSGKVVWGHIIQVNDALFETGDCDHPGDVVYDPEGLLTPSELEPIAKTLFALKGTGQQFDAADPQQAALKHIADHLENERTREFGLKVPSAISQHPLRISTIFFARHHLHQKKLATSYFPVVISDHCPGLVMVLPSLWWPKALLDQLDAHARQVAYLSWRQHWQTLAQGRDKNAQEYFQYRLEALERTTQEAYKEALKPLEQRMYPFTAHTCHPWFEWTQNLTTELNSYAENVLQEVECDRALGKPLNLIRAQNAFAASYTCQSLTLYDLLLSSGQGNRANDRARAMRALPDEIQYVALGIVAGCDAPAWAKARLLIRAWNQHPAEFDFIRPEVGFIFSLLAQHLEIQRVPRAPFQSRPQLDALLEGDAWRIASADTLKPMLLRACQEHTTMAPHGPFEGLPIALFLVLKLREILSLANPTLEHLMMKIPLGPTPDGVTLDAACDPKIASLRQALRAMGFDEIRLANAFLGLEDLPPLPAIAVQQQQQRAQAHQSPQASSDNGDAPSFAAMALVVHLLGLAACIGLLAWADNMFFKWLSFMAAIYFGVVSIICVVQGVRFLLRHVLKNARQ
jgi:hypothetical protein